MATYEHSIGKLYGIGQTHESTPVVENIRVRAGIIFKRAKAIERTITDAAKNGLSVLPQSLAGINPPVSVDEAIEAFIKVGKVRSSHSDSDEMIVYEGPIASIVSRAEIQQGSPYIRD